jgi:hypothetical protein
MFQSLRELPKGRSGRLREGDRAAPTLATVSPPPAASHLSAARAAHRKDVRPQ